MTIWGNRRSRPNRVTKYQWKLDARTSVVLDASGAGTTQLIPGGAREKWVVNFIAVNMTNTVANSTLVPTMIVYRAAAVPGNQLGGTFSALMDNDSTDTYVLNMNEGMVFAFTGGDPASIGNVHIEGIRYVWE